MSARPGRVCGVAARMQLEDRPRFLTQYTKSLTVYSRAAALNVSAHVCALPFPPLRSIDQLRALASKAAHSLRQRWV